MHPLALGRTAGVREDSACSQGLPGSCCRLRSLVPVILASLVFLLGFQSEAVAQSQGNPQDLRAQTLIQQAIDAYQNLDLDTANARLREALRRCGRRGCSPEVLARIHVTIGVLALGGQNDTATAVREFSTALQIDRTATVDANLATPEITAAFLRARRTLRGDTAPARLLHTPVVEQLVRTPVPIYIETGINGAVRVDLYYRVPGGSWTRVAMERVARGWGAEIPCTAVNPPAVDYYVWAFDERDVPYAEAGNDEAPLRVNVVTRRTRPAPSMPGRLPPERCRDANQPSDEGESCAHTSDCATGLVCQAGTCVRPQQRRSAPATHSTVAMDLGGGIGLAFFVSEPGYAEAQRIDPNDPRSPAACPPTISCPTDLSGVGLTGYLWLAARYHPMPRIGIAGTVRWQPDAAQRTTLASLLFGLRGYYTLTPNGFARTGPVASVFAGIGGGQIQPRAPAPSASRPNNETGHIVTGLWNVHAGVRLEYGLAPWFHLGGEATMQFMFFRTLLDLDLQGFAGVHF